MLYLLYAIFMKQKIKCFFLNEDLYKPKEWWLDRSSRSSKNNRSLCLPWSAVDFFRRHWNDPQKIRNGKKFSARRCNGLGSWSRRFPQQMRMRNVSPPQNYQPSFAQLSCDHCEMWNEMQVLFAYLILKSDFKTNFIILFSCFTPYFLWSSRKFPSTFP